MKMGKVRRDIYALINPRTGKRYAVGENQYFAEAEKRYYLIESEGDYIRIVRAFNKASNWIEIKK